jgi:DNA-binding GntR family transcriptional regulator
MHMEERLDGRPDAARRSWDSPAAEGTAGWPGGAKWRRPQLSEDAANFVRKMITSGLLAPGEAVKAEAVGGHLGISGTPVREALQALRVEGFLDLTPRKGFVVAPFSGKDIRDIFTAHALLSGELAYRAAKLATADDLAELERLHNEVLDAASSKDMILLEVENNAFHGKINLLANARKIVRAVGLVSVPTTDYASVEGWTDSTVEDHAKILASLRSRDARGARAAMHAHIIRAGELLAAHYESRAAEKLAPRPR